jgi:hypothetical protein
MSHSFLLIRLARAFQVRSGDPAGDPGHFNSWHSVNIWVEPAGLPALLLRLHLEWEMVAFSLVASQIVSVLTWIQI